MRATLIQLRVDDTEDASARRRRAADLVRARAGDDLVVLPEGWAAGAWNHATWPRDAEPLDGPTARAMSGAARDAAVWLHAGTIVERAPDGTLYNTALVFGPDGGLRAHYRKIHRYGFDTGEAALMGAGERIVTVPTGSGPIGLATCYDLRFPELFRALLDAGARFLVVPAAWPAGRLEHLRLFVRTRAVEEQCFVLACVAVGEHGGVRQAGHSMVVDPWGTVLAEAGEDEEVLTAGIDPSEVDRIRSELPVLRDRVLGIPAPAR
ncbi:nitrilase-related carbon-nitrogen hydrolase [Streptomyces erythrochromogenes]|uniref:nitrilase-related carbon-nitrogen hydrolase n=1 Tax=Streptomyces erythrochromogenes TaxID=285574 RepID=UPI0036B0782B